jgi:hypothetical protein
MAFVSSLASASVRAQNLSSDAVDRALATARLGRPLASDRRRLSAALVPTLKLHAAIARMDGRGGPWSVSAWASLTWPLERVHQDPVEHVVLDRRSTVAAEMADIWRRREALRRRYESDPDVNAALDFEEADAELHAFDGGGR